MNHWSFSVVQCVKLFKALLDSGQRTRSWSMNCWKFCLEKVAFTLANRCVQLWLWPHVETWQLDNLSILELLIWLVLRVLSFQWTDIFLWWDGIFEAIVIFGYLIYWWTWNRPKSLEVCVNQILIPLIMLTVHKCILYIFITLIFWLLKQRKHSVLSYQIQIIMILSLVSYVWHATIKAPFQGWLAAVVVETCWGHLVQHCFVLHNLLDVTLLSCATCLMNLFWSLLLTQIRLRHSLLSLHRVWSWLGRSELVLIPISLHNILYIIELALKQSRRWYVLLRLCEMLIVDVRAVQNLDFLLLYLEVKYCFQVLSGLLALHLNLTVGLPRQVTKQLMNQMIISGSYWWLSF